MPFQARRKEESKEKKKKMGNLLRELSVTGKAKSMVQ
jgi:hypothetical protein